MSGPNKKQAVANQSGRKSVPGKSPWLKRLGMAAGVTLVVGLVALMLFNADPISGVPEGTEALAVGSPEHVDGDIHEGGDVPAGGAHDAVWANCGFYDTEIRSENAVHSLEHGAVWISYSPDLASEQIDRLKRFTGGIDKILISPIPGQDALLVASAWGNQLELSDADDPRLEQFLNEFERGRGAPEPGARCQGGVGNPVG